MSAKTSLRTCRAALLAVVASCLAAGASAQKIENSALTVSVNAKDGTYSVATRGGQPIFTFTLQPTMISTATAVTDASRRGVGGITLVNPYICKVRLVE